MKKTLRSVTILILSAAMALLCAVPSFAFEKDLDKEIDQVFAAKMESTGTSSLQELVWYCADNAGNGEEWWIISLRQAYPGQLDFSEYRKAYESYAENSNIASATTRLKTALTLQAVGSSSSYIEKTADDAIGQMGIMSYIYGLHILNNGAKSSKFTRQSVTDSLLDMQLKDGGWAVMGDGGDVDVTGMAVQALSPSYSTDSRVKEAIDKAINFLSGLQQSDGSYASFGVKNPESIAQVVLALCFTGNDCCTDGRFIKGGTDLLDAIGRFESAEGQYSHSIESNPNASATGQALYSLISYRMMKEGRGSYYIFGELSEPSVQRPDGLSFKAETESPEEPASAESPKDIRPLLYIIAAVAVVIACIILVILKKKSYKSYLFVVIIGVIAALGIRFINIEKPSDYYGKSAEIKDPVHTFISIRCDIVAGEKDFIPKDGIILDKYEVIIDKGQTAYDQLISAVRANSIQIDGSGAYVSGIANIYELDFGDLSGWMFRVNGEFSDVGCGEKILSEGDYAEWLYTKDLGKDIGNEYMGGNQ